MPSDSYARYGNIARSPKVRAKLIEVRDRIYARAETIDAEEQANANLGKAEGTRPRGRPYARVTAREDQEFGTKRVTRRRVLGRAARS